MKYTVALLVLLSLAGRASAGEDCPVRPQPNNPISALGRLLGAIAEDSSPTIHEQRQREREQRATYEALLAAGAPEPTACAAALNPQVFQAIAPTYLNRPAR
jgi:hypothetical protein